MTFTKETDLINIINSNTFINLISDAESGDSYAIMNITSRASHNSNIFYVTSSTCTAQMAYNRHLLCNKRNTLNLGYAFDTNIRYNVSTKFIYCTINHIIDILLRFLSKNKYQFYNANFSNNRTEKSLPGVIILDKMYLNHRDLILCLYLWKAINRKTRNECPKIIVINSKPFNNQQILPVLTTMATSEAPKNYNDFNLKLNEVFKEIPDEITKGVTDSTIIYYPEHIKPTIIFDSESNKYPIDDNNRYIRAAILANEYYKKKIQGVYIICVPRWQEADIVINALTSLLNEDISLFSNGLTTEQIGRIYAKKNTKIIVTTCVFKLSTIINDISLIIDTMSHNNDGFFLEKNHQPKWITLAESIDRMRMGTKSTHYLAMCSENIYKILDEMEQKFHGVPHGREIYEILKYNLNPLNIFAGTSLNDKINIELTVLKNMGLVLRNYNNYRLTNMGYFCFNFPLNIRNSAIVYLLCQHNKINPIAQRENNTNYNTQISPVSNNNIFVFLALLCSLECYGNGLFFWPKKIPNEDFMSYSMRHDDILIEFEKKYGGYSDISTIINVWIDICKNIDPLNFKNLKKFCIDNHLNYKHFRDASLLLKKCIFSGNKSRIKINANYDKQTIINSDVTELGNKFYNLLKITHQGYETIITKSSSGQIIANCCNQEYRIDNKSIHTMHIGNRHDKIYYSLVKTQKKTTKGVIQIVNVLHAIPDNDCIDDNNLSIFLSDAESEQEEDDFYIDSIENTE